MLSNNVSQNWDRDVLDGLRHTYKAVAVRHVRPWWAWALLAVVVGFALSVTYIINQNGQFFASQAAAPPYDPDEYVITLNANQPIPVDAEIVVVWTNKTNSTKRYVPEPEFFDEDRNEASKTVYLVGDTDFMLTTKEVIDELGESGQLAVLVSMPNWDIFLSSPVRNRSASIDISAPPLGNLLKTGATYTFKYTFEDASGVRRPAPVPPDNVFLSEPVAIPPQFLSGKEPGYLPVINDKAFIPGPLSMELYADAYDPADAPIPADANPPPIVYSGHAALPTEMSGTFEIVFYDSEAAFKLKHANDSEEKYEAAYDEFDINDIKQIIYTPAPETPLVPITPGTDPSPPGPTYNPPPTGQGALARLTITPILQQAQKASYGKYVANLNLKNTAATVTENPGTIQADPVTFTFTTTDGSAMPDLYMRTVVTKKGRASISSAQKCKIVKPAGYNKKTSPPLNSCTIKNSKLKNIGALKPGAEVTVGIMIDTRKLGEKVPMTMEIRAPGDFMFTHAQRITSLNKKRAKTQIVKSKHALSDKPIIISTFTK